MACTTLAKSPMFGCSTIISTIRSEWKITKLKDAGADIVLVDTGSITVEVKKATGGKGVSKAVELVGGNSVASTCECLQSDGLVSAVGSVSGEWTLKHFDQMAALAPDKRLAVFFSLCIDVFTAPIQQILDLVGDGKLKVNLDKVFSPWEIRARRICIRR